MTAEKVVAAHATEQPVVGSLERIRLVDLCCVQRDAREMHAFNSGEMDKFGTRRSDVNVRGGKQCRAVSAWVCLPPAAMRAARCRP